MIMRAMEIPPFPKRIEISNIESLTNARLSEKFSLSEQAAALAGYMFYPASDTARASFGSVLRSVPEPLRLNLKGMRCRAPTDRSDLERLCGRCPGMAKATLDRAAGETAHECPLGKVPGTTAE
jgi:hypothetical protein